MTDLIRLPVQSMVRLTVKKFVRLRAETAMLRVVETPGRPFGSRKLLEHSEAGFQS
jgi:hypothetical protein